MSDATTAPAPAKCPRGYVRLHVIRFPGPECGAEVFMPLAAFAKTALFPTDDVRGRSYCDYSVWENDIEIAAAIAQAQEERDHFDAKQLLVTLLANLESLPHRDGLVEYDAVRNMLMRPASHHRPRERKRRMRAYVNPNGETLVFDIPDPATPQERENVRAGIRVLFMCYDPNCAQYGSPLVAFEDEEEAQDVMPAMRPAPATGAEMIAEDWFQMVDDFHVKFGCKRNTVPTIPDEDSCSLRMRLVDEEVNVELQDALERKDLVDIADAIGDSIYVLLGFAVTFGIDMRPIFRLIHEANMCKTGGATRADGKIMKPPGWQPPDIAAEIDRLQRAAKEPASE